MRDHLPPTPDLQRIIRDLEARVRTLETVGLRSAREYASDVVGVWENFTPDWRQGGTALGTSTNAGRKRVSSTMVWAYGKVVFDGTGGSAGNDLQLYLPQDAAVSDRFLTGTVWASDGGTYFGGVAYLTSVSHCTFRLTGYGGTPGSIWGSATYFTPSIASGDSIWWSLQYEPA